MRWGRRPFAFTRGYFCILPRPHPGGDTMWLQESMDLYEKLEILTDAAKYDVACTSSGADRRGDGAGMGSCERAGICHSFSADGRCISLLKILFTNECIY